MRDFSWKVFTMTGDVDAYMLYRESQKDESNNYGEEPAYDEYAEENELL